MAKNKFTISVFTDKAKTKIKANSELIITVSKLIKTTYAGAETMIKNDSQTVFHYKIIPIILDSIGMSEEDAILIKEKTLR